MKTDPSRRRIRARRARFDLSRTPRHWVYGDPVTTHAYNMLSVALPPGERWFVAVFREALPYITDEQLRRDVRGFIGQENTHAHAHDVALDYMAREGIDVRRLVRLAEAVLDRGWMPLWRALPRPAYCAVLTVQLAAIAAIEHFTSWYGDWAFNDPTSAVRAMGANGQADAGMTALFLWHGAEELEHSAVAFDAFQAVSGSYALRAGTMMIFAAALPLALVTGAAALMVADSQVRRPPTPRQISRAMREGRVPTLRSALRGVVEYCRPGHHPSQAFRPETAVAYLNGNPLGIREARSAPAPSAN